MSVRLTIRCNEGLVAELEKYEGPIPQVGQYISRPRLFGSKGMPGVMSVKTVTYGILARTPENGFAAEPDPWVEVWV